jgi:diadenylate cyclase
MDKVAALLGNVRHASDTLGANLLVLVTDREELVQACIDQVEMPILFATGEEDLHDAYASKVRKAILLGDPLSGSLSTFTQLKDLLMGAFFEGHLGLENKAVVLVSAGDALDMVIRYDVDKDVELVHLREELDEEVYLRVVERLLKLSAELAREGREGHPVGTLFVLGDTDSVLTHSRAAVLNPFAGHPEKDRNIMDDALWETAKEFALIDGAFLVRGDGVVVAAGRYVDTQGQLNVPAGLGGRHIAAASITAQTKAVAIVVSSSGTIRVFKDGRVIMMVGRL